MLILRTENSRQVLGARGTVNLDICCVNSKYQESFEHSWVCVLNLFKNKKTFQELSGFFSLDTNLF